MSIHVIFLALFLEDSQFDNPSVQGETWEGAAKNQGDVIDLFLLDCFVDSLCWEVFCC